MLDFFDVIESSSALSIVNRDLNNARLSHAYLFLSKDDNYLKTFCEYVCKLLINQNNTKDTNKNNLRVDKHIHPDVKFFGEEKAIDVKTASQIVEETDYSPFESDKKIFVLFNVQDMNEASQNKILKTIEEPPKNTYFILAANNKSRLLQTIISRVKEIKLEPIEAKQIVRMLREKNILDKNAEIIANCSNGNATFAEKLALDESFIGFYKNIVSMFDNLNGSKDVLTYSVLFNDKKIDKNEFFDICVMLLRDVLFVKSQKVNLIINTNLTDSLNSIARKLSINYILELIETCVKCKEMLQFNVGTIAVVDEFLFKLAEVKVKCRRL